LRKSRLSQTEPVYRFSDRLHELESPSQSQSNRTQLFTESQHVEAAPGPELYTPHKGTSGEVYIATLEGTTPLSMARQRVSSSLGAASFHSAPESPLRSSTVQGYQIPTPKQPVDELRGKSTETPVFQRASISIPYRSSVDLPRSIPSVHIPEYVRSTPRPSETSPAQQQQFTPSGSRIVTYHMNDESTDIVPRQELLPEPGTGPLFQNMKKYRI